MTVAIKIFFDNSLKLELRKVLKSQVHLNIQCLHQSFSMCKSHSLSHIDMQSCKCKRASDFLTTGLFTRRHEYHYYFSPHM